jgi:hypothetical protein
MDVCLKWNLIERLAPKSNLRVNPFVFNWIPDIRKEEDCSRSVSEIGQKCKIQQVLLFDVINMAGE